MAYASRLQEQLWLYCRRRDPPHNGPVIRIRDTHVGPVHVTCVRVDDNAIGEFPSEGDDRFEVCAIGRADITRPMDRSRKNRRPVAVFVAGCLDLVFWEITSLIVCLFVNLLVRSVTTEEPSDLGFVGLSK